MCNRLFGIAMSIGVAILAMVFSPERAWAERRIALAIGNSSYESVPKLPNPSRDAIAIGQMFRDAHFDNVDVIINASNQELKRALRKFEADADQADIAVIYYAGHGLEIGGINYLIPVDAKLASDRDAEDEAVRLDRVISSADSASKLRVIILDACRDNPFPSLMKRSKGNRAVSSGLGKTEPTSTDTLIAYAAKAGSVAEDGDGQHSPFTSAILKSLTIPGLDIRLAFGRVKDEVMRATGSRQEPFVYGSLGGSNFPLVPAPKVQEASEADIRGDYELVAKVGTLRAWDVFLNTHKTGFYADLARAQVAALTDQQQIGNSVARSQAGGSAADSASKTGNGNLTVAVVPLQQPPGGRDASSPEALEWNKIKDSSDPAVFEKFIQRFPNAPLALNAQRKLDALRQAQREREAAQKAAEEARIQAEQKKAAEAAAKKREADERRAKEAEAEQKAKAAEAERNAAEARQKAEQAERERAAAEAAAARAAAEKQAREAEEARKKAERDAKEATCKSEQSRLDQIVAKGSAGPGMDDLKSFAATATCQRLSAQMAAATDKFKAEQAKREREAAEKAAEEARIQAEQKKAEAAATKKREDDERRAKALEAEQQAKAAEAKRKAEQAEKEKAAAEAAAARAAAEKQAKEDERRAKQAEMAKYAEAERLAGQAAKEATCKNEQSRLDQIVAKGSAGAGMDDLKSFAATSTCQRLSAQIAAATDKFKAEQAKREAADKAADEARSQAEQKKAEAAAAKKREDDERRAREAEAAEKAKAAAAELAAQKKREEDERRAKALEAEQHAKAAEAKRKAEQAEQEKAAAEAAAARAAAEKQAKEDERRAKQAEIEQKAKAAEAERLAAEERRKAEQAAKDSVCQAEESKLEQVIAKGSADSGIDDLNEFARSVTCERLRAPIVAALDKFKAEAAARAATMPNSPQLVLAAQRQLVRLGCQLPGKPDGNLNDATTSALTRFLAMKDRATNDLAVTTALVDDLTKQTERVCPLECKANEIAKGDKCVTVEKKPAVTSRRKDDDEDNRPARRKQQIERRQAEPEPRRQAAEPRARIQASSRPSYGGGGGGGGAGAAMTGVGF
jgi:hypothetical protein